MAGGPCAGGRVCPAGAWPRQRLMKGIDQFIQTVACGSISYRHADAIWNGTRDRFSNIAGIRSIFLSTHSYSSNSRE